MVEEDVELQEMRDADEEVAANQPLIGGDPDEEHVGVTSSSRTPGAEGQNGTVPQIALRRAGKIVWLLTFSAGISGLLFGYDTGVISSTLVSIGSDLSHRPLTTTDKGLVTAITSLFALFSAPATGYLADKYGRRAVILLASVLFILGAFVQAVAGWVWIMVFGRAAVGAAVGLASCATPLYITELAPAEMRGRLVTIQSLFITGGQVVAYLVGWGLAHLPAGWRWMVGLGAVPAIVQLFLLAGMFESPRWLVTVGQRQRARGVLMRVYGGLDENGREAIVEHILASIETEIAEESKADDDDESSNSHPQSQIWNTTRHLIQTPGNRRALTIACMLQGLQQLCGFNSLMYFSATIFALIGFTSPIGTSLSIAVTNFLFTIAAFRYIDTVGRRNILLCSIPFMILGLLSCSVSFRYITTLDLPTDQDADGGGMHAPSPAWPSVLLVSMILYVAAYAIGLGCVPWQQSELFPLRVRSLGSAIATSTNWLSNFIIGITFLPMLEVLGPSYAFGVYAAVCIVGWFCIWRIYPETAGLELEGIGMLLKDGWDVKASVDGFKARREK